MDGNKIIGRFLAFVFFLWGVADLIFQFTGRYYVALGSLGVGIYLFVTSDPPSDKARGTYSAIAIVLLVVLLPVFFLLNRMVFTEMESNLKYLARALVLILDGLMLLVLGTAFVQWVKTKPWDEGNDE